MEFTIAADLPLPTTKRSPPCAGLADAGFGVLTEIDIKAT